MKTGETRGRVSDVRSTRKRTCAYCKRKDGTHARACVKGERAADRPSEAEAKALLDHWAEHPWNWLTGKNVDGQPLILTTDEKDFVAPIKPFPAKDYLKEYVEVLLNERIVFVDKSRQMLISTTTLLVMDWWCKFSPSRRCLVSKHKEGEAAELLRDKIRNVHRRLPVWVQEDLLLTNTPATRIDYENTGSYIRAVAQNVAVSEARGGTASIVLVDEAAFQDQFGEIMSAVLPMASRVWAVSTANIGNPGARVFKRYLDEGKGD